VKFIDGRPFSGDRAVFRLGIGSRRLLAGVANARTAHDTALFVFLHSRWRWPGLPTRINDLYTILMLHVPIITLSECASEYSKAGMI
jgi:hypothetical protein